MRQRGRWRIEARVADETGPLVAVWFGRPWFVADQFQPGQTLCCTGAQAAQPVPRQGARGRPNGARGARVAGPRCRSTRPPRGCRRERIRDLMWRSASAVHDVVEPLPARLRAAERLPGPARPRSTRSTSPRSPTTRRWRATGWRSRSCCCSSCRWRRASGRGPRARGRRRSTAPASSSSRGSRRCRSR